MEQISLFDVNDQFPNTYEDVKRIIDDYVREGETDEDFFSWGKDRKTGGKIGYLYDTKILEFFPKKESKDSSIRFYLSNDQVVKLDSKSSIDELLNILSIVKKEKKNIFRNLITETFACCNDFKRCSEVGNCIHPENRFYNGCLYRKNLEAGRNFFKGQAKKLSDRQFNSIIGLDFETANGSRSSACAVAAVKYDLSGNEQEEYYTLINPHEPFDFFNVLIHGITPEMVINSPDIHEAMKNVFCMIDPDSLLVCHNSAFDMSVLVHSLEKDPLPIPDFYYTCTYRLSSRILPQRIQYSLPAVAMQCGITDLEHHSALSDARTCAKILLYFLTMFDGDMDRLHQTANINYGRFTESQFIGIHKIYRESDPSKKKRTMNLPSFTEGQDSPFYKKNVAFTGALQSMTRDEAFEIIEQIGGYPSTTVNKKTDYLVTGYQDSRHLADGKEKSSKALKAEELLSQGHNIEIIPEDEFLRLL